MDDDLISRQDAIEALKICDSNYDGINCDKCPLRDERWEGAWEDDGTNCYEKLMRDSAKLLSMQPENKEEKAMKFEDVICTEKEILAKGYKISNNIIENIDISIIGHFNNIVCLRIFAQDCVIMGTYNDTQNLGLLIKAFVELFDLTEEDGVYISKIKNLPCRIITESGFGSKVIGFGHFMRDRFVLTDEFAKITEV